MSRFFSNILKKISGPEEVPVPVKPKSISEQVISYTNRLILIPFPSPDIINPLYIYLEKEYRTGYKIWNLSEYSHESELFSGKCVEFLYLGYPNPHLSAFYSIFESIRAWLMQDERNMACLHCQSTKCRSFMTLAGYLVWSGEEQNIEAAFAKICKLTRENVEVLPSQKRYMRYLQIVNDSQAPRSRRIRIRRVIIDGIPVIEKQGTAVRPYLQVFRNSQLVFNSHSQDFPPVSYEVEDLSIVFDMELEIQDDVFVRCRHLGRDGQAVTIFRMMFHTAFVDNDVIRFEKNEIDGASCNPQFPNNFRVDFICDINELAQEDPLQLRTLKLNENDKEKCEQIKIDKEESDEEMDKYFKELENK